MIKRKFSVDNDAYVKIVAKVIGAFKNYKQYFIDKYTTFDDPYESELDLLYENFKNKFKINDAKYIVMEKTEQLQKERTIARKRLQKLYSYVKLAFDKEEKLEVFGKQFYAKSNRNDLKLCSLIDLGVRVASESENWAVLNAAGYSENDKNELSGSSSTIKTLLNERKDASSDRPKEAAERTRAMNDLWEKIQEINRASKTVFMDNYAIYKQFFTTVKPRKRRKEPENEE